MRARLPIRPSLARATTAWAALATVALAGCQPGDVTPLTPPAGPPIFDVEETDRLAFDGLRRPVHVLTTADGTPHLYAHDEPDLAFALGFVSARDRYFVMDMARRLMRGTTAALIGDDALATDIESRTNGSTRVLARLEVSLDDDERARFEAYAAGVNAYIDAVAAQTAAPPSELELAAGLLGADEPVELMQPFTVTDVAAVGALVIFESGIESTPLSMQRTRDLLPTLFAGAPLEELRREGARVDIFERIAPPVPIASAAGWGLEGALPDGASAAASGTPLVQPAGPASSAGDGAVACSRAASTNPEMLDRAIAHAEHHATRLGRGPGRSYGSNAWAVGPEHTASGHALLASDGHLALTVPSFFIRLHTNTVLLGGGELDVAGITVPGLPLVGQGHNGRVAWGQTQLFGDINDYYRMELVLDADGAPAATVVQGAEVPVIAVVEQYESAAVPLLGSDGGTFAIARYETDDGRSLVSVEGTEVDDPDDVVLEEGQALINVQGDWLIPGDVDGDGVVQAIAHDYAALDGGNLLRAVDAFGRADDVVAFREATRSLVAYSQNLIAADVDGHVFYSGYQAVPCRGYLPRDDAGRWLDGADPRFLLDGTRYPGFTVPLTDAGLVDESFADDATRCVVPFDEYPQALDPPAGYVINTNNDPAGITFDGDLFDEPHYIGGPWLAGFRAERVAALIEADSGAADVHTVAAHQADNRSPRGAYYTPLLLDAVDLAEAHAADGVVEGSEGRMAALYVAHGDRIDGVVEPYLAGWDGLGYEAASGVETFYHQPDDDDRRAAVATMVFNAWFEAFKGYVFDDEGLPSVFKPTSRTGRERALRHLIEGSQPGNPAGLASYNPDTGESAFFDVLGTDEIETLDEIIVLALVDALDALAAEPTEPGRGGFGSDDPADWLWGLRHLVLFPSILGEFLDADDPLFGPLLADFSVTPDRIPIADDIGPDDPRHDLPGFPRPGDYFNVDAGHPGAGGPDFQYADGPVMRFAVELDPAGVQAINVIPGGQSARVDSPHFDDQIPAWLANEALADPFAVDDVVAAAVGREVFVPAGAGE